ncbi:sulfur carrier protein ThiS [Sulfurimonas sp. SAG-AH-194-L11]|nr:sulfur carrier protein ThiS [Sulfurimonas sp. SAG-AH-194-L11]MDF1877835.1 sulfur carrier protein ThiS [Sulfurimonas sp. SAG-AH-194-L11]
MKIIVNGQDKDFAENITIEELLKVLELEGKVMAAAVNMDIVKQNSWNTHRLNDGDKLELLDFVGGG